MRPSLIRLALVASIAFASPASLAAQSAPAAAPSPTTPAPRTPERHEAEIKKFEDADRAAPPAPGAIVFIGSSSIRRWNTLDSDFPGVRVMNRGFGGSEASDVVYYAKRAVLPVKPSKIVYYAGDNDLARFRTPEEIAASVAEFWQIVTAALPQTRMAIISVKPSLQRWALVDKTRATNVLLQRLAASDPRLTYIDVFTPMIGPDGQPIPSHFVADGLHLTPEGYRVWTAALKDFVR